MRYGGVLPKNRIFTWKDTKRFHIGQYLLHYLEIVTTVTTVMLLRSGTDEALYKKKKLWRYIRKKDKAVYRRLR